jgi:hypothetical protein
MSATVEHHAPPRTRARLRLADVPAPVLLDLEEERAGGFTVARDLPFLGLGREVRDESGRLAHIENIYVDVGADTPRLVMDLTYAVMAAREETVSYETPSRLPAPPSVPKEAVATREGTLLFVTPSIAPGDERLSTAPVCLYEDTDALKDGLASAARGLLTAGRAALSLGWRGTRAGLRLVGRLSLRVWRASRHLGATYADAPASPAP